MFRFQFVSFVGSRRRTDSDWHPIMDGDVLGAGCTKVRCQVPQYTYLSLPLSLSLSLYIYIYI